MASPFDYLILYIYIFFIYSKALFYLPSRPYIRLSNSLYWCSLFNILSNSYIFLLASPFDNLILYISIFFFYGFNPSSIYLHWPLLVSFPSLYLFLLFNIKSNSPSFIILYICVFFIYIFLSMVKLSSSHLRGPHPDYLLHPVHLFISFHRYKNPRLFTFSRALYSSDFI